MGSDQPELGNGILAMARGVELDDFKFLFQPNPLCALAILQS